MEEGWRRTEGASRSLLALPHSRTLSQFCTWPRSPPRRKCTSTDSVAKLKARLDSGRLDIPPDMPDGACPHLPAVVLKTWLRELSEPVVPIAL